jgi:DinB family protein
MKNWIFCSLAFFAINGFAQQAPKPKQPPANLRSILLLELRETHNQKNWFVSGKEASEQLTPEQAAWSDGKNHSVGQLVAHLVFWNSLNLAIFKGEQRKAPADNNDTFKFDPAQWDATIKQFDSIMTEWEEIVEKADEATLARIAPTMARISMHNAYHIGEIIAVRKAHGMWNPDLGVK